jgi:hypothetical protein
MIGYSLASEERLEEATKALSSGYKAPVAVLGTKPFPQDSRKRQHDNALPGRRAITSPGLHRPWQWRIVPLKRLHPLSTLSAPHVKLLTSLQGAFLLVAQN